MTRSCDYNLKSNYETKWRWDKLGSGCHCIQRLMETITFFTNTLELVQLGKIEKKLAEINIAFVASFFFG